MMAARDQMMGEYIHTTNNNNQKVDGADLSTTRRTANYKPNIWNYDHLLHSLTTDFKEENYKSEAESLKEEISSIFVAVKMPLNYKLELINEINKLALSHYFEEQVNEVVDECNKDDNFDQSIENLSWTTCPLDRSVVWFNVKKHMRTSQNLTSLRLARLSFNMVQHQHQKDLKEILRWWKNVDLSQVLTFTRDRTVESFLWAVGVAYEPQHGSLRKWLAKTTVLILIIDDVYDIYGSMEELEIFTSAVERWDPTEIEKLPETMKRCFLALYDTANDISLEIEKEKGWKSVLPHLRKVWTDFCKSLLVEAKWYHMGHTPSLCEYLENGWISSSGPLLSLHIIFGVGKDMRETFSVLNNSQEIIRHTSLIIRLSNDLGTAKNSNCRKIDIWLQIIYLMQAELERGDAPSSISCYMREEMASEEEARDQIRNITTYSWNKINGLFLTTPRLHQPMVRYIINAARVASFIYQKGDGFGVQDQGTRDQVLSCLINPLPLV